MKNLIVLMLTTLSINLSSCTKDDNKGGSTTSPVSTTASTSPVESDYRSKFQGKYNCTGVETFYSIDTSISPITTKKEFVLTVMKSVQQDSTMTFTKPNLSFGTKINVDGTTADVGNIKVTFALPDSICFYIYTSSHPGSAILTANGKKFAEF